MNTYMKTLDYYTQLYKDIKNILLKLKLLTFHLTFEMNHRYISKTIKFKIFFENIRFTFVKLHNVFK